MKIYIIKTKIFIVKTFFFIYKLKEIIILGTLHNFNIQFYFWSLFEYFGNNKFYKIR